MSVTASSQTTAQFIAHFIRSIKDCLATMARTTVHVGPPALKTNAITTHDVSGIIGFSGEFTGSMVLSFEIKTARAIVSAFAGVDVAPESPDFADAIGELANMIAGGAKKSFGGDNSISVPSIVMGKGHTIARLNDVPCLVIPCRTDNGDFAVEVSIKNRATKPV